MADKTIGSLPAASDVDDLSLFVIEQNGTAMKATGAQWKGYAQVSVSQYVGQAQSAAEDAQAAADDAESALSQLDDAVTQAQSAQAAAESAQELAESAKESAESAKNAAESASETASGYAKSAESSKNEAVSAQQAAETAKNNAEASAIGAANSASQAVQSASDASVSATEAASSATAASQAANSAESAQALAETAQSGAEDAETGAEAARDAILNMIVEAITLETGQPATVTKGLVDQVYKLTFGLPKGDTGDTGATGPQGVSIESILLTSGNHAPGTTDTYTITLSNDSTFQFTVYNGANGTGVGDFMASGVVPMTGNLQMDSHKITGVANAENSDEAVNKGQLDAAIQALRQEILSMNFFIVQPEGE